MQDQNDKFGDFQEIKQKEQTTQQKPNFHQQTQSPVRVRLPRKNELIGMLIRRLGGNKMEVLTTDGKTRNCRVPGRYKRRLWLRPKDIIMIVPWELDINKGDIIYKYRSSEINQLRKRGLIDTLTDQF